MSCYFKPCQLFGLIILVPLLLSGCARVELVSHLAKSTAPPQSVGSFKVGNPYRIGHRWYRPQESYDLVETGIASWYGPNFHGKKTANGEIFDKNELTAAHRTLQMPSLVRVTNLDNGRSLIVRVNDRGPYKKGRIIDLSEKAAELLGYKSEGTAKVRISVLRNESLEVARVAKNGQDTRGYEIAANRNYKAARQGAALAREPQPTVTAETAPHTSQGIKVSVAEVERQPLTTQTSSGLQNIVPGHERGGSFYPDPMIAEYPVTKSAIYVQAGSFSVEDNALRLASRLKSYAETDIYPVAVNGSQFYRVRLGPINNVEKADRILDNLTQDGYTDSIIVVE